MIGVHLRFEKWCNSAYLAPSGHQPPPLDGAFLPEIGILYVRLGCVCLIKSKRIMEKQSRSTPSLGAAEAEILHVIWRLKEGTVRQVYACLPPNRGVTQGTVQTVMRRLRAKGFIEARTDDKAHVFRPAIAEERVIAEAVRQMTHHYFKGNVAAFMEAVAKDCLSQPDRLWLSQVLQTRSDTEHPARH